MKELQIFISFFKSSFITIVICIVFGLLVGVSFFHQQKTSYFFEGVYELNDSGKSYEEKVLINENVVGLIREQGGQGNIGNSDVEDLYISKVGPFTVKVETGSDNPQSAHEKQIFIFQFLKERGNYVLVGELYFEERKHALYLYLAAGSVFGLSVGVLIELMKKYIKTF